MSLKCDSQVISLQYHWFKSNLDQIVMLNMYFSKHTFPFDQHKILLFPFVILMDIIRILSSIEMNYSYTNWKNKLKSIHGIIQLSWLPNHFFSHHFPINWRIFFLWLLIVSQIRIHRIWIKTLLIKRFLFLLHSDKVFIIFSGQSASRKQKRIEDL